MSFDGRALPKPAPRPAIVVALGLERATLARHARAAGWQILQSGPGPTRAAHCAEQALAAGARALVSWGFAGGLDPALRAGALVLPRWVRAHDGAAYTVDVAWHAWLEGRLGELDPQFGALLTVPVALNTPAQKAEAAASGAVAVDMESAAVAAAAAAAGVPFLAVRVIVDTRADTVPRRAEQFIDARGNRRFGAAVRAALAPRDWPAFFTLAQRFRAANRSLVRVAELVAARGLLASPRGG